MKKIFSALVVVTILISFFCVSALPIPIKAEGISITPTESDYSLSGSSITGLKPEFISGLTPEQKQNIRLELPASINGKSITAIGESAFKSNSNYRFIYLDLSKMNKLTTIGIDAFNGNKAMEGNIVLPEGFTTIKERAFYNASMLSGDLILPNSLKIMEPYAFANCSGIKGRLQLSNQLVHLPNYAFNSTPLTGELIIPASVQTMGESVFRQSGPTDGFSGKLIIPDTVKSIGKVSFSNQNGITDIQFSKNMTAIPDSLFRYCKGLSGILEIPDHIQTIGSNSFAETNIKAVYLPAMKDHSNSSFLVNSTFSACSNLNAIIVKEQDYATIRPILANSSSVVAKLTYEKSIQLHDDAANSYPPLLKLFNFKYNFVKQTDNSWISDSTYQLPSIINDIDNEMGWSKVAGKKATISKSSLVGAENDLYSVILPEKPVFIYSENINKVYDGQKATLSIKATHPDYVPIAEATNGDVVFSYTWRWVAIGSNEIALNGFDKNSFDVTDVLNPEFEIGMNVTIQTCVVNDGKAIPFDTTTYNFGVNLTQADPLVIPQYKNEVLMEDGLPSISLATGSTHGTISWDSGQSLKEGSHNYQWTFTPPLNPNNKYNYKTKTGSSEINAKYQTFDLNTSSNGHGKISPNGLSQIKKGTDTLITLQPDVGYEVTSFQIDGVDKLDELSFNTYTLANIQNNHTINVSFSLIKADEVEDIINNLPEITDGNVTREDATQVLEAKQKLESMNKDEQNQVTQDAKDSVNDLLSKLPQITVDTEIPLEKEEALLDNLTSNDIETLLTDESATIKIRLSSEPTTPQKEELDLVESNLNGAQTSEFLDINIKKTILYHGQTTEYAITNLARPIKLVFNTPENLPIIKDDCIREFSVIRIHENNGIKEVSVLKNESSDQSTIIISSDAFSLYTLVYKDTSKVQPTPTPDDDNVPPNTGDNSNHLLYLGLGILSLIVLCGLMLGVQRKTK